jgi:hypothetical protein
MSDYMMTLVALVMLVTILGCIPYLIWVIRTALRKNWRKVGYQIGVPIMVLLILLGVTKVDGHFARKGYYEDLFDAKVDLGTALFKYDSERSFNGDGYSISVYELPPSIRARFESRDDRLLNQFPKKASYRDRWATVSWREAPMEDRFIQYLDFALSSLDSREAPELLNHFESIRRAMSQPNTFYAFFYYDHGDYPGNIDLLIVDLKEGRLYLINHNT